jgi:DENN (AEX-3) domain
MISSFFILAQHVYIPLIFFSGIDYIDAPTPYMMGLHSGVDTSGILMDGVRFSSIVILSLLTFLLDYQLFVSVIICLCR